MKWTDWAVFLCAFLQVFLAWAYRDHHRRRQKMLRDFLTKNAAECTSMAEKWRAVAADEAKSSAERMTAVSTGTVLLGASIAYQDAAQDVDSFLVHGERLGQRGAIKVDEKAVKPETAGAT